MATERGTGFLSPTSLIQYAGAMRAAHSAARRLPGAAPARPPAPSLPASLPRAVHFSPSSVLWSSEPPDCRGGGPPPCALLDLPEVPICGELAREACSARGQRCMEHSPTQHPGKPPGVQRCRPRREMDGSEGGCVVQLARQDENLGSWVSRLYANLQVSVPRKG